MQGRPSSITWNESLLDSLKTEGPRADESRPGAPRPRWRTVYAICLRRLEQRLTGFQQRLETGQDRGVPRGGDLIRGVHLVELVCDDDLADPTPFIAYVPRDGRGWIVHVVEVEAAGHGQSRRRVGLEDLAVDVAD